MMKYLILSFLVALVIPILAQGPVKPNHKHFYQYTSRLTTQPDRMEEKLKGSVIENRKNKEQQRDLRSLMMITPIQLYDSIYTWEWDDQTFEWVVDYRYVDIVYDENHHLVYAIGQQWNGVFWESDEMIAFEYDDSGNEIELVTKSWDGMTWQNDIMIIKTYDALKQVVTETYLFGDGEKWSNYSMSMYEYNLNGKKVSDLYMKWTKDHWRNNSHDKFEYDEEDKLIVKTSQSWLGDYWVYQYMNRLSYDLNDSIILEVGQIWNQDAWEYNFQRRYVYDPDLHSTIETEQDWSGVGWENRYQYVYSYNTSNDLTTLVISNWNNGQWFNKTQITSEYDNNKNLTDRTYYEWNDNTWLKQRQYVTTYDELNFITSTINKAFEEDGVTITFGDSMVVYYRIETALKDVSANYQPISIYPNPTNASFTIRGEQIEWVHVFNFSGQRMYSNQYYEAQSMIHIELPNPVPGIYFVQVLDKGKINTQQLVIK